jgi:hypothetical protein
MLSGPLVTTACRVKQNFMYLYVYSMGYDITLYQLSRFCSTHIKPHLCYVFEYQELPLKID